MEENAVKEFVYNFKGMTWDELGDELDCMDRRDMKAAIKMLKVRFV